MAVNTGDLLVNLIFPQHAVDFYRNQDKTMFLGRLIREIYGFVKVTNHCQNAEPKIQPPLVITAGSRATSLRTPTMAVFNEADEKIRVFSSDTDLMVMHPEIVVGDTNSKIHVEFIEDPSNIGYGAIKAVTGDEKLPHLFVTDGQYNSGRYLSGLEVVKDISKSHRDLQESGILDSWQRTGPAFERLNFADSKQATRVDKADIVVAVVSAKDYFNEQKAEVITNSSWSAEVKEAISAMPISFVQVAPKSCKESRIIWRVSFSMHELVIGQSLNFHQRQVYLVIKCIIKYLLETISIPEAITDKDFSSYMIMNAFFAFCDLNPMKNWSTGKVGSIVQFFQYFVKCLSEISLSQYLLPQNNLFKEVSLEWSKFYTQMVHFDDEAAVVKLLLDLQATWRVVQFERSIKVHWSGDEMTLEEAKSLLKELTVDAVINLEPVRAAQAIWNHSNIYQSIAFSRSSDKQKLEPSYREMTHLEFLNELLTEMKSLVAAQKISKERHNQILSLVQKLTPKDSLANPPTLMLLQQMLDAECERQTESEDSKPYYTVKYEKRGETDDHIMEFNTGNVVLKFINVKATKYVFPYTDRFLQFSEPLMYFVVCQQALEKTHHEEVEQQISIFPKNIPVNTRNHPFVRLISIFIALYFREVVFPDFEQFKVNNE